jgi:hypothetical protein
MTNFDGTATSSFEEQEEVQQEEHPTGLWYRAVRFKGGEEIICGIYHDDLDWTNKKFILINQPMLHDRFGEFSEWSTVTDQIEIEISTDLIRAIYTLKESIETKYDTFIEERYFEWLREDLKNPDLTDEDRESIEDQLSRRYDGSEPLNQPVPVMFGHLPVSNTIH